MIDTNVVISAFAFGGIPEKAVKKAFIEADIYLSATLLKVKEYRDVPLVLKSEGKIDSQQLKALISGIAAFVTKAEIVHPQKRISVCRDAKDNMLLECCFEANARFLITSDNDLLSIENLPFNLEILTPREFIEIE